MTSRELVVQHVTECMVDAFTRGDLVDAKNLEVFLKTVEGMTEAEYTHFAEEAETEQSETIA